jgi:hypothetical protein
MVWKGVAVPTVSVAFKATSLSSTGDVLLCVVCMPSPSVSIVFKKWSLFSFICSCIRRGSHIL